MIFGEELLEENRRNVVTLVDFVEWVDYLVVLEVVAIEELGRKLVDPVLLDFLAES